jgi:MoaA/NifB/PqqE/SkfB family radical SAM enzyme
MKAEIGTYPKQRQILHKILPIDTPLEFDFHIVGVCNFKCNYCLWSLPASEMRKQVVASKPFMDWDTFQTALDQIRMFPRKIKHITLTGGEPMLHEQLSDMVKAVHDAEVTDYIQVISNGSCLTPELSKNLIDAGLSELKISLQGITAEKYYEISQAKIDWDKFYENIEYFSSIRGECQLKIKIADTALDAGEEAKFFELFGDIADAVAVEHIYDAWTVNGMEHSESAKSREKTRYGNTQYQDVRVCKCVFIYLDVLPDGLLATRCHRDLGLGNIHSTTITEAWNGAVLRKMRLGFLKDGVWHKNCTVNASTAHPEDILDGHEAEILARMV